MTDSICGTLESGQGPHHQRSGRPHAWALTARQCRAQPHVVYLLGVRVRVRVRARARARARVGVRVRVRVHRAPARAELAHELR